jgi:predicted nucleic acid-binding protein
VYLDTSAAAKLLKREAESFQLREFCGRPDVELVGTDLLETELRRLAHREEIPGAAVSMVLDRVALHALTRSVYTQAGLLPGRNLRSLDALHISAALRLEVDVAVIYDLRMREGAVESGLRVLAPGDVAWPQ